MLSHVDGLSVLGEALFWGVRCVKRPVRRWRVEGVGRALVELRGWSLGIG
ncbi:hypothetical protein [Bartonella grahamii]|nr:hypothetical protein [Bartonella grahamii]